MSTVITGKVHHGLIEPDTALPPDWPEGIAVSVKKADPLPSEIDLTGDSPEAIAAWVAHFELLHEQVRGSTFPEELSRILAEAKSEELCNWEESNARAVAGAQ